MFNNYFQIIQIDILQFLFEYLTWKADFYPI